MPTEIPLTFECHNCDEICSIAVGHAHPGITSRTYCSDCYEQLFTECAHCHLITDTEDTQGTTRGDRVCTDCACDHYTRCTGCDRLCPNGEEELDDEDEPYCAACLESTRNGNVHDTRRNYCTDNRFVESGQRAYSVEIECNVPAKSLGTVTDNIAQEIGVTTDGSIDSEYDYFAKEFITPKLSGKEGGEVLKKLSAELVKAKATVNRSCGLHVHIDMSDIKNNIEIIKTILLFYLTFEPVIFSYLPMSRRDNNYCKPLSEFYHEKEIVSIANKETLEALWYREPRKEHREYRKGQKYDDTRYAGINFHSLFSHDNIEIRYHSGTIDHTKMAMWIKLHVAIIDRITSGYIEPARFRPVKYLIDVESKQKEMFALLELPKKVEAYFIDRQSKFGVINSKNKDICAE